MRHLQFDGKYYELLKSGKKKATIRLEKPKVKVGDVVYIHSAGKVLGKAKITRIITKKISQLTDEDARLDGFKSRSELIRALKEHYPQLRGDKEIVIIEFDWVERFDKDISSEDFAWMGAKIDPVELAKLSLQYDDKLTPKQRQILELLIQSGSIRKAAMRLGGLHKRDLFRRILRVTLKRLIEKGVIKA